MATTAAPIARNIRSRLRLSAAELGGLRKRTLIAKVDILPVQSCHGLISEIPKLHLDNSGAVHFPVVCVLLVSACALVCPVGTHARETGHTGDEPHNHPPKPNDTPARPRDGRNRDRLNSRKNSRKPGVDRTLRPTQKRPPPANPTLPPPAPRAPPRACSKAVGEMITARTADMRNGRRCGQSPH